MLEAELRTWDLSHEIKMVFVPVCGGNALDHG